MWSFDVEMPMRGIALCHSFRLTSPSPSSSHFLKRSPSLSAFFFSVLMSSSMMSDSVDLRSRAFAFILATKVTACPASFTWRDLSFAFTSIAPAAPGISFGSILMSLPRRSSLLSSL